MNVIWRLGVSGDFAIPSNWNPPVVPGPADDALILRQDTYTVTSSVDETVDSLTITDRHATLFITGASRFTSANGGVNSGTIAVDSGSAFDLGTTGKDTALINVGSINLAGASNSYPTAELIVTGEVSLHGRGNVDLSGGAISDNGSPATLSTDNLISGSGAIGGFSFAPLTLVNEARGVIDASTGVLNILPGTVIQNSGILESTGGLLDIFGGATPHAITINNTPAGVIEANGANAQVQITGSVTIVGGTLETKGANAAINVGVDGVVLDGSQPGNPLNIHGNVVIGNTTTVEFLGTINNTGSITLESGISSLSDAIMLVDGDVTLDGHGQITLTTFGAPVSAVFSGVLTNVDNVISGTGLIDERFGSQPNGILINEAHGIIDANAATPLILTASGTDTNAGLMEATNGGTLLIENVTIDNFLDHTKGTIEAGQGSTIELENATIDGGVVAALAGSSIEATQGASTITGAVVLNGGTIGAEGGDLTLAGDVFNAKGVLDANDAKLVIDGAVKGGTATLEGTGQIEFGASSSADVSFAANASAVLKLDAPSDFTGTVSGFSTGDYIDLANIDFADNPTLSYSSRTGVLTVTDKMSGVTDTIMFKGAVGTFSAQSDGNGGTLISDPPPASVVTVSHDQQNFVFAAGVGESQTANSPPGMVSLSHGGDTFMFAAGHAENGENLASGHEMEFVFGNSQPTGRVASFDQAHQDRADLMAHQAIDIHAAATHYAHDLLL